MQNLGQLKKEKRSLLINTAVSLFLHGAPIWLDHVNIPYQRVETEKTVTVYVLACISLITLIAKQRKAVRQYVKLIQDEKKIKPVKTSNALRFGCGKIDSL